MDYTLVTHVFRAELEKLKDLDQLPSHLKNFPRGCCGVVSELLGDYLSSQLGLQVDYVCGEKDGGSHAWIECDGVVIDITSDQFEGRPPVYIAVRDSWYSSWQEESRHPAVHQPGAWTYQEERAVLRAVLNGAGLSSSDL